MSQVCRFYQMGTCKFGDSCRFEHPGARSQNRFSTFGSGGGGGAMNNAVPPYQLSREAIEKDLGAEAPQWILSAYGPGRDAPEQLFGGYPREQSTDEIRWFYEKMKGEGKEQQALSDIQALYENAKQQMQTTLRNLDQATRFIVEGANKHPNRNDVLSQSNPPSGTTGEFAVSKRGLGQSGSSSPFGGSTTSAFGSGGSSTPFASSSPGSAFGQPSGMGAKPSPFGGGSAFGQPSSMGSTSAFGQPSAMGAKSSPFGGGSAFGQASQTGGSAFGQASSMGNTGGSAFGQTASMGAKPSPFGSSAFGQPSQPSQPSTGGGAFGQPSQPSTGGGAFGQPSQMGSTGSGFGQPSTMGAKPSPFGSATGGTGSGFSAFSNNAGSSPFGQASQNQSQNQNQSQSTAMGGTQNTTSPFGQKASPFGAPSQQATPSPFGQPSQPATSSPFGQPSQPAASNLFSSTPSQGSSAPNPFSSGQTTGFGAGNADKPNPFGQPGPFSQPSQSSSSPFGQPSQQTSQPAASNPFAQPSAQQTLPSGPADGFGEPYPPGSTKAHPPLSSYSSGGQWKGNRVFAKGDEGLGYMNGSGKWVRIWFPRGAPNYYKETELPDDKYDAGMLRMWEAFEKTGMFEAGLVPELPPKRIHCSWDI